MLCCKNDFDDIKVVSSETKGVKEYHSIDTKKVNLNLITLINHLENQKTPYCTT